MTSSSRSRRVGKFPQLSTQNIHFVAADSRQFELMTGGSAAIYYSSMVCLIRVYLLRVICSICPASYDT